MNDPELQSAIEDFLLANHRWVKSEEICERFGVRPRQLRALDDKPGLCSEFAISGDKGFKHVRYATDDEFMRSYRRSRKHGIAELIGARRRKRYRERLLVTGRPPPDPPPLHERVTGQTLLPV